MSADLHVHSIYSDGSYTPAELIDESNKVGITTIALADHDTVEGVAEMVSLGESAGIDVIPAIEFSTFQKDKEIHILGYYIDYNSQLFLDRIKELFNSRLERAKEMIRKLNIMGVEISYQEVQEIAGDKYVGRPHIARTMVEAGYINSIADAFSTEYIGNGGKACVAKSKIRPIDAIDIIQRANGIAVLAHPYFISNGGSYKCEDIKTLVDKGLEGIEVYHSKQDQQTSEYYLNIAEELGLLVTGGSDFHGDNSSDVNLGDILLDDEYVYKLKNYYQQK